MKSPREDDRSLTPRRPLYSEDELPSEFKLFLPIQVRAPRRWRGADEHPLW